MNEQGPDYSKCWANCLGDCDGGMSREHIVSKCLYGENVKVKGFPWCKDEWAYRSIDNVTSKVLCRRHNSALSPLDDAACDTLETIGQAFDLWHVRSKYLSRSWTVSHFRTNMLLLERWCLKTLINVNLNLKPGWPIDGDSPTPTDELVGIAFGKEKFKPPMGLYVWVSDEPEQSTVNLMEGEITVQTETSNNRLSGASFDMWGMKFLLNLHPEERTAKNGGRLMGRGGMDCNFRTYDDKRRLVLSHVLKFAYDHRSSNGSRSA